MPLCYPMKNEDVCTHTHRQTATWADFQDISHPITSACRQRCANQSNLSVTSTVPHPSNTSDVWILPCLSTPSLVPPRGSDMRCHASAAYSLKLWMALRLLTFLSSVLPNLFSSVSVYSHIPFLAWSQNWLDWILIYYVFSTTTTTFIPEYRPIYPISQLFFSQFLHFLSLFPWIEIIYPVLCSCLIYRQGNFMHVFSTYFLGLSFSNSFHFFFFF